MRVHCIFISHQLVPNTLFTNKICKSSDKTQQAVEEILKHVHGDIDTRMVRSTGTGVRRKWFYVQLYVTEHVV